MMMIERMIFIAMISIKISGKNSLLMAFLLCLDLELRDQSFKNAYTFLEDIKKRQETFTRISFALIWVEKDGRVLN